jgi:hypothetical protein
LTKLKNNFGQKRNEVSPEIKILSDIALKQLALTGANLQGGLGPELNRELARIYSENPDIRPAIEKAWVNGAYNNIKEIKELLVKAGGIDSYLAGSKLDLFSAEDLMKRIGPCSLEKCDDKAILKFAERLYDHPPFFDLLMKRVENIKLDESHRLGILQTILWNAERLTPELKGQVRSFKIDQDLQLMIYAAAGNHPSYATDVFRHNLLELSDEAKIVEYIDETTSKLIEAKKNGKLNRGQVFFRDALIYGLNFIDYHTEQKAQGNISTRRFTELSLALAIVEAGGAGDAAVLQNLAYGIKHCQPGCLLYKRLQIALGHEDLRRPRVEYLLNNSDLEDWKSIRRKLNEIDKYNRKPLTSAKMMDDELKHFHEKLNENPSSPCGPLFN